MDIGECEIHAYKSDMVNAIRCSISSMLVIGLGTVSAAEVVMEFLAPMSQLGITDQEIYDMLNDATGSSSDEDDVIGELMIEFGGED
ncbi:hypothetical protein NMD88_03705 [Edwardsiella tarda]|uniref:hypothetical protein n=1 Tax=Edwardsiella tarda TaxID=636 RepID=UPI00351C0DBA